MNQMDICDCCPYKPVGPMVMLGSLIRGYQAFLMVIDVKSKVVSSMHGMHGGMKTNSKGRLLVFNCHEAWVYQLTSLDYDLDIAVGLPGRHILGWDYHTRPLPPGARTLAYQDALASSQRYTCLICHNPSDLMDIKHRPEPRILVLHLPVEARLVEEKSALTAEQAKSLLTHYIKITGAHVVGVTPMKGRSWGHSEDIIPFGIDANEYLPYLGHKVAGIRISNFVTRRRTFLNWDFHEKAFAGLPVTLIGHNPDIPHVYPSQNWDHLKQQLQSHRFYIHTADPVLEDGYNMAMVEAMAAGLPILGNTHPSTIIKHGINGFISNSPAELKSYAQRLLTDRPLAVALGRAARETAQQRFSLPAFKTAFEKAIETAQLKRHRAVDPSAPESGQPIGHPMPIPDLIELPKKSSRPMRKTLGVRSP